MKYCEALKTGRRRAEEAAEAIRRWTGVPAIAVCAVKTDPSEKYWQPVGQQSWKEIASDDGLGGKDRYHLLIVDEGGAAKACSRKRYPLSEVMPLADRLPLPVAMLGQGELWRQLNHRELSTTV